MGTNTYTNDCRIIVRYIEDYIDTTAKKFQLNDRDKIRYYLTTRIIKLSPDH